MLRLFWIAGAAAAQISMAGTSFAWDAPAEQSAPAVQIVALSFNPPLDQPVHYRRHTTSSHNGMIVSHWLTVEYIFRQRHGGFRVEARTLDVGVEAADAAVRSRVRQNILQLQIPHVLLLDQAGAVVGLENEEAFWADAIRSVEEWYREDRGVLSASQEQALAITLATFRDLPSEARIAIFSSALEPVTAFGSARLRLGERLDSEQETAGPFGPPVRQRVETIAEKVENGHVFVSLRAVVPREEFARAAEAMVALVPVTGEGQNDAASRERSIAQLPESNMTRTIEASYEVDVETGLTRRLRSAERVETRVGTESADEVTTVILERTD